MSQELIKVKEWLSCIQYLGLPYHKENSYTQLNAEIMTWFTQLQQQERPYIHTPEFSRMPKISANKYSFTNPSNANAYYQAFLDLNVGNNRYVDYDMPLFTLIHSHLPNFTPLEVVIPEVSKLDEKAYTNLKGALTSRLLPSNTNICNYFTVLSFTKCFLMELCGVQIKNYKSRLVFEIDRNIKYCNYLIGEVAHFNPYYISTSSYTLYYEAFKQILLDSLQTKIQAGGTKDEIIAEFHQIWSEFELDFNTFVPEKMQTDVSGAFYYTYLYKAISIYLDTVLV